MYFRPQNRSIPLLVLLSLLRVAATQSCWYPDGQTEAKSDLPCSNAAVSACCGPRALCLDNGLCFLDSVISRGSCTDKEWGPDCPGICQHTAMDSGCELQPCDPNQNTFVCGLYNTSCQSGDTFHMGKGSAFVLRPSQVPALSATGNGTLTISPSSVLKDYTNDTTLGDAPLSSSSNTATFTAGQMAGVGAGIGLPLLLALVAAIAIILRQQRRISSLRSGSRSSSESSKRHYELVDSAYNHSMTGSGISPQHHGDQRYQLAPPLHGHFREAHVNEMDAVMSPQELGSTRRL